MKPADDRELGPVRIQPAAQQHDVAAPDHPGRPADGGEHAGATAAARTEGVTAEHPLPADQAAAVGVRGHVHRRPVAARRRRARRARG